MLKIFARTPLSVIVLVNLILKLGMFCYISPWNKTIEKTKIVVSDSRGYEEVAERLINNHTYAPAKDTIDINKFSEYRATGYIMNFPDGWMMPVYPTFLAAIYFITGIKPYIAILIQILLSVISVVLVYRIGTLLFKNKEISTIASLFFALDIQSIYSANELLTDTLFVLLLLAGIYYFIKAIQKENLTILFISAVFLGFACLTRLLILFYPALLILLLLVFSAKKWKWKLKAAILYIIIFTLFNGIWSYRNHAYYGHWQLTAHGGWTLLMFNTSLTKTRITHENIDSIRVAFQKQADSLGFRKSKDIFEQSEIYQRIAVDYIKNHKGMYILTTLQGCMNMFLSLGNMGMAHMFGWTKTTPDGTFAEISPKRMLQNFSANMRETLLGLLILTFLLLQYAGAMYGMIKLIRTRNFLVLSLIFLTFFYFGAITGILGNYRFKLPVVPFICIAAGYGYATNKIEKQPKSLLQKL